MSDKWLEEIHKEVEEERRNYRGPHCCMTTHYELLREDGVVVYNSKFREYGIEIPKSQKYLLTRYCTDCGQKLPESLRNKWFQTLKQEWKLEEPEGKDKKKVPKQFLTDEWWNPDQSIINYDPTKRQDVNKKGAISSLSNDLLHCCIDMDYELLRKATILIYSPKFREYAVKIFNSDTYAIIDYCLFCGKKMPTSVRHEWFDILEQEYGLDDPSEEDKKKVPKEFLTDEWWKSRGL